MQVSLAPSCFSSTSSSSPPHRLLYLDWMRTIAVYLVVAVHSAISVARVSPYSPGAMQMQKAAIRALVQFGMPFFFFLSGSAACLQKPASFAAFLRTKSLRLMVPCLIAMPIVVLPTAYIGRRYRPCAAADIDDFPAFAYDFAANQFACGGFEWLWFLPASFAFAFLNFPLLASIRAAHDDAPLSAPGLLGDAAWTLVVALVAIAASSCLDLSLLDAGLALAPYVVLRAAMRCRRAVLPLLGACSLLLPSLALAYRRRLYPHVADIVVGLVFYNLFFIAGFVRQLVGEGAGRLHRLTMPLRMLVTLLLLALCAPFYDRGVGYLFAYPLYPDDGARCVLFVLGTWNLLSLILDWGRAAYDQVFDPALFRHGTRSSLVVYIFHWLYIDAVQVAVVIPLALTPLPAISVVFPVAVALSLLTYAVIVSIPGLGYAFGLSSSSSSSSSRRSPKLVSVESDDDSSGGGYGRGPSRILLEVADLLSPRSNDKSETARSRRPSN